MRFRSLFLALLICGGMATLFLGFAKAQAPVVAGAAPTKTAGGPTSAAQRPQGTLVQVMRGILFPNSNVIFFAQSKDPAAVKPPADPSTATDPLSDTYGGWVAVENSAIALSEAANLLTIPGRLCSNGRPVPLKNPDWARFVQGLRAAGMTAYKAAQTKDQDKMLDASDAVSQACYNCHNRYRDVKGGDKDRCM